jgi:hypothetical protein
VETNSSIHIVNVMQGCMGTNNVPVAEIKMEGVELDTRLGRQFASKKEGQDFARTYLANLGKWVKIEILRVVAKCFVSDIEIM